MLGIEVGDSPVIAGDRPAPTEPRGRGETAPDARPGALLPHAWLGDGESLYDKLGAGLTLLVLGGTAGSGRAVEDAARARGVPLKTLDLRSRPDLRARYGADLLLVRPDQHIAWRGDRAPGHALALIDRIRGSGEDRPALSGGALKPGTPDAPDAAAALGDRSAVKRMQD